MYPQLEANIEDEDCTQSGKYESGRMEALVCRAGEYMGDGAANDGADDAQDNGPQ
jgi:hypothetical protein